MIREGVAAPSLAPRMGTEDVRARGGVRYRELQARSLVNRCTSPRMPFAFTANPFRGCAMACRYCYAAYTHEFMGITTPEEFHSLVYVKTGPWETETARHLASVVRQGEEIALGTATDPYQPAETQARVTRRFLELAAQYRGLRLSITTKGALVLRDVDLLQRIARRSDVSVHISVISPHADLLRELEPWAPPPEVRLDVMRRLRDAGIDVRFNLAPVLPGLTDRERDLDELMGRVAEAGVRQMMHNVLFLRSPTKEKYLRWLAGAFPRYLKAYEHAYAGRVYLSGRYREHVRDLVVRLRRKHGLVGPSHEDMPPPAQQMARRS
jgi:DNA repair photolyase